MAGGSKGHGQSMNFLKRLPRSVHTDWSIALEGSVTQWGPQEPRAGILVPDGGLSGARCSWATDLR